MISVVGVREKDRLQLYITIEVWVHCKLVQGLKVQFEYLRYFLNELPYRCQDSIQLFHVQIQPLRSGHTLLQKTADTQ